MRTSLSVGQLAVAFLSLSPIASASGLWPRFLPDIDSLVVRADPEPASSEAPVPTTTEKTTAKPTASSANGNEDATTTAATTTKGGPITTEYNTGLRTQSESDSESGSGTGTKTKTGTKATTTKHKTFDARDPPGGVVMITPSAAAGSQLYKIGDHITWGWNYTSIQAKPTAVDVLVSCKSQSATWTLTQNMTYATPGSFTWDTEAFQTQNVENPLAVDSYTLLIHDSDSAFTAAPEAGYLAPFAGFTFVLYTPQPYTPLASGWVCATCSGGVSDIDKRAFGAVVAMSVVTVFSFTWFVTGFGGLI
ncbi:hypothetical protein QBC32DRAFT_56052 [Pseudoneurospora amorphoporcata]|uniref:DUF7137 domain-containing protein n=1 Tax=Pseudoneurospora amorphoporcata TaxID=241081 RepID=A0AAN6P3A8_9PEZI|nr:hypothetical protein QBC32DRAFT_56052 [Pseudoneurospora amorphoporcata]